MKNLLESRHPTKESRRLVDDAKKLIQPGATSQSWFDSYSRDHGERISFDVDLLRDSCPSGARVLDAGAAPFLFSAAAHLAGYSIQSLDLEPDRFLFSEEILKQSVRQCDIEKERIPFPDLRFDAVVLNECFEHLRIDPIFTMTEIHRVLRPDGLLFLSTPNGLSLRAIGQIARNRRLGPEIFGEYSKLRTHGHMGHVREYTAEEVAEFLTRIGFAPKRLIRRGGQHSRWYPITRIVPQLAPFFSVVAARE